MSDTCKVNMFQEFTPQIQLNRVYIVYKRVDVLSQEVASSTHRDCQKFRWRTTMVWGPRNLSLESCSISNHKRLGDCGLVSPNRNLSRASESSPNTLFLRACYCNSSSCVLNVAIQLDELSTRKMAVS